MTEFANELQTIRMDPSLTKQVVQQPIPSNTKDYVVSAANVGITAETVHRTGQMSSNFKQGTTSQEQPTTLLWRARTLHEGLPGQDKMIQESEAKEFGNFAADEEYEPADDQNIKEIGF